MRLTARQARMLAWLAAIVPQPAFAGATACELLPNGSFTEFLSGWTTSTPISQSGDGYADASIGIVDGSSLPDPLDDRVASLQVVSVAFGPTSQEGRAGTAVATAILEQTVPVQARYLTMRVSGGWEATWEDAVDGFIQARVEVARPIDRDQLLAVHTLADFTPPPLSCELALSVLALFGNDPPIVLDLLAGQEGGLPSHATVRIVVTTSAVADQACEGAEMVAALFIDELQWCQVPPGGVPGDVTGDGAVDVLDLLAVVSAWGPCPPPPGACPADTAPLGGDGQVDVADVLAVINHWS